MYSEMAFWMYQQMESLAEPMKFFAYMGMYVGIPILIFFLVWLDRKIESRKEEKEWAEYIKQHR